MLQMDVVSKREPLMLCNTRKYDYINVQSSKFIGCDCLRELGQRRAVDGQLGRDRDQVRDQEHLVRMVAVRAQQVRSVEQSLVQTSAGNTAAVATQIS